MSPRGSVLHIFALLLILCGSVCLTAAGGIISTDEPNRLLCIRFCSTPQRARIVLDFTGAPLYYCYQNLAQDEVRIDLPECAVAEGFELPEPPEGGLPGKWQLFCPNFRRLRFSLTLKYPLPFSNIRTFTLADPPRLVLDLEGSWERRSSFSLTQAVRWTKMERATPSGYLLINELRFKPADAARISLGLAGDDNQSRETLSSIASRKGALAAVNGGFFSRSGGALGLVILDGRLISLPVKSRPPRTCFGLTNDGRILMDRLRVNGEAVMNLAGYRLNGMRLALGCGPRLIRGGKIQITAEEEGLGRGGNDITRKAGRTALGVTREQELILITVNGYRDSHFDGMKMEEMADFLLSEGAVDAMCLDGGNSAGMWVSGHLASKTSGKRSPERKIANALLVFDESPRQDPEKIELVLPDQEIIPDGKSTFVIRARVFDAGGSPAPDGTPVRFEAFPGKITGTAVTSGGEAEAILTSPLQTGPLVVSASCGRAQTSETIQIRAGEPERIYARFEKIQENSWKDTIVLEALVVDRWFNPIPGVRVVLEDHSGQEHSIIGEMETGPSGCARLTLTGYPGGEKLRLKCGNVQSPELILPKDF